MYDSRHDVLLSAYVDLSASTSATRFVNQPQVAGRKFLVIDCGYTSYVANSGAVSGVINVGTAADPDGIVDDAKVPEVFASGRIISNNHRVASHVANYPFSLAAALKNDAGDIVIDTEVPLVYAVTGDAGALGEGFLWVRLRPLMQYGLDDYQY